MSLVGCRKQRDQIHAELIKDMPFVFAPGVPALTVMLVGDCQDGIESPPPIPVIRSPHAAGHAEATVDRHFRSLTGFQVSSAFMSEACWS